MENEDVATLLLDIKKLLILSLIEKGFSTNDIGKALGVSYRTIDRLVPRLTKKKVK